MTNTDNKKNISKNKNKIFIAIAILVFLFGIFLRTYHFSDWLKFRGDQVRDAYLVSGVVSGEAPWPLLGPFMSYSGAEDHSEEDSFHIGPIYYYFQIISAKIFGDYPDKFAYPDLFFSILSIPLLFFFLRIYFEKNSSLGITALYAISAYFINYSRFGWNSNLIPFFVLLFLFSLFEFLKNNDKTRWLWVISLGFALGIGFQIHAITMVLFSIVAFVVFLMSMKRNRNAWKKWAVVMLIFIILNAGQIISEMKTNFGNTKTLLQFSESKSSGNKLPLIKNDADCHIEANFFFLSSYGSNECSYDYSHLLSNAVKSTFSNIMKDKTRLLILSGSLIFSGLGYFFLVYYNKKEKDKDKKQFLCLIAFYVTISFLIMIPLSSERINDLRYLTPVFFMPFLFLGFIIKYMSEKIGKKYVTVVIVAIVFLIMAYSNVAALLPEVSSLLNQDRTCSSNSTILGEIEPLAEYIASSPSEQRRVYVAGDKELLLSVNPLIYLLKKHNIEGIKIKDKNDPVPTDDPVFVMSCRSKMTNDYNYQKIGNIYVYNKK